MTPPPPSAEQTGESTAGDSHRSLPTPFLTKTYQLVEDSTVDDVISWNDDGSTFIVWRPAEFARDLLPKYFKHNNFSSFVRQLNTYGFRKVVPDRWEFANDCFRKGEKRLLCDIHRRKISATANATSPASPPVAITLAHSGSPSISGEEQVLSSNSPPVTAAAAMYRSTSCTSMAELLDENERLRRENQHLTQELSHMKSLCNNIYVLMTKYGNERQNSNGKTPPLDLMPRRGAGGGDEDVGQSSIKVEEEEDGSSPKLFGVCIGSKRSRRDSGEEEEQDQQQGTEDTEVVKSEPLDRHDVGWITM